jgi:tetratricopeptide (TPR) repeat protein
LPDFLQRNFMMQPSQLLTVPPGQKLSPRDRLALGSAALARDTGRLPIILVALFAFLLASFPARNSDLWMHLAAGRQLLHQFRLAELSIGWPYDLVCYGLYSAVGGAGLVFFKSLLVVGLGLCLLLLCREGSGWWIAAVCTALALLAMSLRLLLQPAVVSYFLFAIILWSACRTRNETAEPTSGPSFFFGGRVSAVLLVVAFWLWANTDSWLAIGLATLALIWFGRLLDSAYRAKGNRISRAVALAPSLVAVLGLIAVACLINPLHIKAFTLPPELDFFARADSAVRVQAPAQHVSPFQPAYLTEVWRSPAGLAYYPLLGLGLLSFVLALPRWRWERVLPWAGLAAVSAMQVKAIPFFAIVAAPVLAWNLQEFFARHSESERQQGLYWSGATTTLRWVTCAIGVVFLLGAWPGWLQSPPFEPRRWGIEPAPSLERGATAVQRWHEQGHLTAGANGLHLSPASASAFAWFCPAEKAIVNDSLAASVLGIVGAANDGAERLRASGIDHVVVYDTDRTRLFAILSRFLATPQEWPLLDLQGELAIFGWRDPARKGMAAERALPPPMDIERLAFHPTRDKQAPAAGPPAGVGERRWWEVFWKPAPPRLIDRDQATSYLLYAETLKRTSLARHLIGWEKVQSAGIVGAAAVPLFASVPGALLDTDFRLVMLRPPIPERGGSTDTYPPLALITMQMWQPRFAHLNDDTPPSLLYLAVRAARRALAINPEDANTYLVLGDSYLRLLHDTREREWADRLPQLLQLRRVQAAAALNRAIELKPELAQAHLKLGGLYQELGYLDMALQHLRAHFRLMREAPLPSGISADVVREQQAQYEEELKRLAKLVDDGETAYAQEAVQMRVVDRAATALRHGLASKALDLLLDTNVANFGPDGMALELELLLKTGQPDKVLDWSEPEQENALGRSLFHSLRVQALASLGDYDGAQEEAQMTLGRRGTDVSLRDGMSLLIGQAALVESPTAVTLPDWLWRVFPMMQVSASIDNLATKMRQEADFAVLRGVMHLEQGNVEEADTLFRLALDFWKDEAAAADGSGLEFSGRIVAQTCVEWLK